MESSSRFIVLVVGLLIAGCGDASSDDTSTGTTTDGQVVDAHDDDAAGRASCTYGGQLWELPSGPCAQAPICGISLKSPCPDRSYIVYSNLWDCTCASGEWSCEIVQSGLNLPLCPDAGVDAKDAAAEAG